jgi:hypothetical protein
MEMLKSLFEQKHLRHFLSLVTVVSLIFLIGCQDSVMDTEDTEPTTDKEAMEKIADEDSSIQSFDEAFNENEFMDFGLGKIQTPVYPFRVWHRVHLVSRNIVVDIQGDTAYATLTKNFEGTLFIKASYDSTAMEPDTTIQKVFNATVTRKLIFVKVANTPRPFLNWKLAAVSLPEGGALSENIDIKKLTIFLPNGETIVVESPNDYYLSRHHGWLWWWRDIPVIPRNDSVLVRVELFSSYEEEDFVTVTFGRNKFGGENHKRRFEFVSSTQVAGGYEKVYEQTFRTHTFPGFFHAVINAFPRQVIFDDKAPVESSIWGIPYFVSRF